MESNLIKSPSGRIVKFEVDRVVAVTPHDTDVFESGILYIGVGGNVKVLPAGQTGFVTFLNVPEGSFLPVHIVSVHTDTTATDMLICY